MSLNEKHLKEFGYNEIHSIIVYGTLEECYITTMQVDLSKSKVITFLFMFEGLPFSRVKLSELTYDMNFALLEKNKYS